MHTAATPPIIVAQIGDRFESHKFYRLTLPERLFLLAKQNIVLVNTTTYACGDCMNAKQDSRRLKQFDMHKKHAIYPGYLKEASLQEARVICYLHEQASTIINLCISKQQSVIIQQKLKKSKNKEKDKYFDKIRTAQYHIDLTKIPSWSFRKYQEALNHAKDNYFYPKDDVDYDDPRIYDK